jgi:hypothetical protein
MKLTLIIFGAGRQEISCPELRFSYVVGEKVLKKDLKRFYKALSAKCDGILNAGESYPVKDLIPYARLFKDSQETVKENILRREAILMQVD